MAQGRAEGAAGAVDPAGEDLHLVAEGGEQEREGRVDLVAAAAAALPDDLVEDLLVHVDGLVEVVAEVLERHGQHLPLLEVRERGEVGPLGPFGADPGEVRVHHGVVQHGDLLWSVFR